MHVFSSIYDNTLRAIASASGLLGCRSFAPCKPDEEDCYDAKQDGNQGADAV
jgi:hypothetical protein